MVKKAILFTINILVVYFIFTCCDANKTEIETIKVDIDNLQNISLFDIFSQIDVIPLETNEMSLIKDITNLVSFDDKYFILDYGKGEILIFNSQGGFIKKISDKGEGPNQYFHISDFDIDYSENVLILLSAINRSIFEYDLNGNFRKEYKLPPTTGAYNKLKCLNKDTIVFWTFDYNNRIKFYSKSKNAFFLETYPENDNILNKYTLFIFPYENYFCRASDNTVYELTNNGEIQEKYKWDFMSLNNNNKTIKKFETIPSGELPTYTKRILSSEMVNYIFALHGGTSKYHYTQIYRKNKRINIFFNKIDKSIYLFDVSSDNAKFYPLHWSNDYVIGFHSDFLGDIEETLPNKILDDNSIQKKNMLNEDDNPVLIKYYFKK